MQTTFNEKASEAFAGMTGDSDLDGHERSYFNGEASSAIPFGVLVKLGAADNKCALYTAGAKQLGVLMHRHNSAFSGDGASGLAAGEPGNVKSKGRVWVTVEAAVSFGAPAYARHTSNGGNTQKGAIRGDNDGVAQVTTLTPTPANTTQYTVNVLAGGKLFSFTTTSDGSATAIEICDALRALMAADSAFTALITTNANGSDTLVLTAVDKGVAFQAKSGGPGVIADALTTPPSVTADLIPGSRFLTTTSGSGLAQLELNMPA